jgi:23S rRNA (guanosine2251-2'-O)-methyltransferase
MFGLHAVAAALKREPDSLRAILVERRRRDLRVRNLLDEAKRRGIAVYPVDRSELDKLSGGGRHQGVVAQRLTRGNTWNESGLERILVDCLQPTLVLVLDGVQDPHNLGACLRSADAAGVCAVIAPMDRAVGLTAVARKVACGAAEAVPFVQVTNLARTLRSLQKLGLWIVGADDKAESSVYDMDFTGPVAIVLGTEGRGLRRLTQQTCDSLAAIPMLGTVESLNVSVATGVFLFEALRQRRHMLKS